jgi:hypothetical protein
MACFPSLCSTIWKPHKFNTKFNPVLRHGWPDEDLWWKHEMTNWGERFLVNDAYHKLDRLTNKELKFKTVHRLKIS